MKNSIQEVFKRFGNSYIEMYNPSYHKLNIYNQNTIYDLLFKISSQVIIDLCYEYLGIKVGITSILHTWSQKGKYYPHIHMLVTGGGINKLGKWVDSELVDSEVIKTRFKNRLLKCIKKLRLNLYGAYSYLNNYDNYIRYIDNINNKEFISYKNKPYQTVNDIYEYFGKHAFRIWIENERIVNIDDTHVYFTYRNYDNRNETRISKVRGVEFIRRFLSHTLDKSFIKIRYYGIMSCKNKTKKIRKLQILTKTKRIKERLIDKLTLLKKILSGKDITRCPKCNGKLYLYKETYNKSPPDMVHK